MKYRISRTSLWNNTEQPIEGAVKVLDYDDVNCLPAVWTVEINTLDELMELQEKAGSPIILNGNNIEIYDDWRE